MTASTPQPHLRLVGADDPAQRAAWARRAVDGSAVAQENRTAAGTGRLDPADPRWVLAARAYSQLEGTALTPEARGRLQRTASVMGIGAFDANLIIAAVQDCARRGTPLHRGVATIAAVPPPARRARAGRPGWSRWVAAAGCALVTTALLVRWLLAGS